MALITYTDKVNNASSALPANKKVADVDMNEIKTVVNTNRADHDTLQTDFDSLSEIAGFVPFSFEYDVSTTVADPGAGKFRLNNTAWNSTLYLAISATDFGGRDVSDVLDLMIADSYFHIQVRDTTNESTILQVSSITNNTSWFEFVVSTVDGHAGLVDDKSLVAMALLPKPSAVVGSVAWGAVTGTLSDQTDLQDELDDLDALITANANNIADLETAVTQRALYNATTTGTVALDCSSFDSWYRILTGNTDFTFTNTPASGFTFVRTLEVITTAGESLTFSTADNVIGTFVNDDSTVNLITINFANYPTLGLRVTVVIS